MEYKIAPIELLIDASEVQNQVDLISDLLQLPPGTFEGIPEHIVNLFFSHVSSLVNNILPSDFSTAISAGNVNEIGIKVKIVGPVEHLAAAIRTNGLHGMHEYILSTVGEIKD